MNAASTPHALAAHRLPLLATPPRVPVPFLEPEKSGKDAASHLIPHYTPRAKSQPRILVSTQLAQQGFLQGVARFAKENHWQIISDLLATGALPQHRNSDGILNFAPYQSDAIRLSHLNGTPRITISATGEPHDIPLVCPDNFAIGKLAAEHLISRNCRHFIWAPFASDLANQERYNGFTSEIRKQGFNCENLPFPSREIGSIRYDDWLEWRKTTAEILRNLESRTGLFAFNDYLSIELAALAAESGICVPDKLAIIGVGNEAIECESAPIPLSSVDPNLEELAYQAASLLASILNGATSIPHRIRVAPRGIVARDSTAISSLENPRVEQALLFISKHYPEPQLGVSTVADSLNISRRQLERDFRSEKGCTVREYIEQTRMNEASRLLLEKPSLTISAIAERVGSSAQGNFFRIFRKHFQLTPNAYREQYGRS